jgi:urea transport system permease protein
LRQFIITICTFLAIVSYPVLAQSLIPIKSLANGTPALFEQLTSSKLKQSLKILQNIADVENSNVLPLFSTMLAGNLYFIKANKQLISVVSTGTKIKYHDLLSAKELAAQNKKDIKKIRVNNKIRVYLRNLIAQLQLTASDPLKRANSLKSLLDDLEPQTIAVIAKLRINEQNSKVKTLMDLALNIDKAQNATLVIDKIKAITALEDSLEPQVRETLVNISDQYSALDDADSKAVSKAADKALLSINQTTEIYGYIDQLFFGLSLGSVLLLAAIGLAITFGMMGVINMAHGEMIMLGAYTTYVVQQLMPNFIEYSLWVALPLAFIVSAFVGILIERFVIRYLHGRPLETLLATFGISLILQQLVRSIFSPLNRQVSSPQWMSGSWEINPIFSLTYNRLYILAFALLVFFVLLFILKKTSLGLNVRAVSQNRSMAKAMGIKTHRVDAMTFGLGSGIAGIAGVALSQLTNVGPNLGQAYIIDSFMVVVFGGVGNLLGTLVAAFSLGIANKILEPMTGAVLASILVLVFIILFIQKRPKGLFPQKGRASE